MPCYDGRDAANLYAEEAASLRTMLCGVCQRAETHGMPGLISTDPTLWVWWSKHQKQDEARKAADAANHRRTELIKQATGKLTLAEREALGIR